MFLIDPFGVLFTNTLVGLMAIAFLLLSNVATNHVRGAVHFWVAGDVFTTFGRLSLLAQPGVLHTTGLAWLTPTVVDLLHGGFITGSAVLHTLAIRQAVGGHTRPAWAWPLALSVPLSYVAVAALVPTHALRVQLMLSVAFVFVVWTGVVAWPQRKDMRSAWLISGFMCFFGIAMVVSVVGLQMHGAPPERLNLPPMPAILLDLSSALAMTMAFTLVLFESLHRKIELLSVTDPLTGTLNRRGFVDALKLKWDCAEGKDTQFALAILDLDHFKRINDTLGHAMGDEVLVGFSNRLRQVTRSSDVIARWGGEEFVLLMPHTDRETGSRVAERARDAMAATPLAAGAPLVTVSIGMATVSIAAGGIGQCDQDDLIARADEKLYCAKKTRNCVVAA